jgi:uncharacterized protein
MRDGVTLLRGADRVATQWKNGQGSTTEIARYPAGKDFTTFEWRVSCARFDRDSDFSVFTGIDRVLVVLSGAMQLDVENRAEVRLDESSEPYVFAGDARTRARVLKAPLVDLNVMTLRGVRNALVCRLAVQSNDSLVLRGDPGLLYVVGGSLSVRFRDNAVELAATDSLVAVSTEAVRVASASSGAAVVLVSIEQL